MTSLSSPSAAVDDLPSAAKATPLRAGLIGAGGFGQYHLDALRKLETEKFCRLAAICDPKPATANDDPSDADEGIARYPDAGEMVRRSTLDYVVISSPPHLHGDHVRLALDQDAFVYLEKPPVPTIHQLEDLLKYPRASQVAVGFQFLESQAFLELKRQLIRIPRDKIRRICASGLWPRGNWYYDRASWAGRLTFDGNAIFDGPLTNAFAHLVHGVFFLAGEHEESFAAPASVRGRLLRARPLQSSDFGWMWCRTDTGIDVTVMAGHCSEQLVPWKITVHTDDELFAIGETDLPSTAQDLLVDSHRRTMEAAQGKVRPRTRLQDCLSYSLSTCASFVSSGGVQDIPASEVAEVGEGAGKHYHVESLSGLVERLHSQDFDPNEVPPWLALGAPFVPAKESIRPDFLFAEDGER